MWFFVDFIFIWNTSERRWLHLTKQQLQQTISFLSNKIPKIPIFKVELYGNLSLDQKDKKKDETKICKKRYWRKILTNIYQVENKKRDVEHIYYSL